MGTINIMSGVVDHNTHLMLVLREDGLSEQEVCMIGSWWFVGLISFKENLSRLWESVKTLLSRLWESVRLRVADTLATLLVQTRPERPFGTRNRKDVLGVFLPILDPSVSEVGGVRQCAIRALRKMFRGSGEDLVLAPLRRLLSEGGSDVAELQAEIRGAIRAVESGTSSGAGGGEGDGGHWDELDDDLSDHWDLDDGFSLPAPGVSLDSDVEQFLA